MPHFLVPLNAFRNCIFIKSNNTVANRYAIAEKGEDNVVTSNTPFTILPFFIL